jgi:uncharacterized lipoprotein YbaY/heat shock protein HslJ
MKQGNWMMALLLSAGLGGCGAPGPDENQDVISGTLSYRERIMLTPDAVARVSLQDVSIADAPARVLAELEIADPGQVPIAFELRYDPTEIDERMSYAVRAEIIDRGELMFTSDTHYPVLTRGAGVTVDIDLVALMRLPTVSPPEPDAEPEESAAGLELAGSFSYMADAALFEDCRDRRVYPVAMEGAYLELERAYLDADVEPGQPLMVQLEGRFLERPAMEGDRMEVMLVVDSFEAIRPEQSCIPPVTEPLLNTYWRLIEVEGREVTTPEGQREAHMILSPQDSRVKGHAGCNNFFGGYRLDGDRLSFGQTGATMMACPAGMDTEQAFLAALGAVDRYAVDGAILSLFQGETLLARFEAVHLP